MSGSSTDMEESDDSTSTVIANPQPNPSYLYYRLFTKNIAVPSEQPASPRNVYVGRVRSDSIAPPQTVLLIKRRICTIECIKDCFTSSTLFCSRESKSPMDDGERVSILTPGSSGSDPKKPMELVVDIPRTIQGYSDYYGERHKIINKTLSVNSTYPKPQYSARSLFIIPLYAFMHCLQYTINSTQKMAKFHLSTLSILMPSSPVPSRASMPSSYRRRIRCMPSYGVFHFSKAFHITAGIKYSTISSVNFQSEMGSWS